MSPRLSSPWAFSSPSWRAADRRRPVGRRRGDGRVERRLGVDCAAIADPGRDTDARGRTVTGRRSVAGRRGKRADRLDDLRSERYAYSVDYPADWIPTPASQDWPATALSYPDDAAIDKWVKPGGGDQWVLMFVSSVPLQTGESAKERLAQTG